MSFTDASTRCKAIADPKRAKAGREPLPKMRAGLLRSAEAWEKLGERAARAIARGWSPAQASAPCSPQLYLANLCGRRWPDQGSQSFMPKFTLSTVNSRYHSSVEVEDAPHGRNALAYGVRGALAAAAEEINAGAPAAVVEVIVADAAGVPIERAAVSVSVASLVVLDLAPQPFSSEESDH